jgi:hypothetical protein
MATPSAEGNHGRERLTTPTRPPDSLLIVETHRRHVSQKHGLQASYVNAHLHRSGYAQHVDCVNFLHELSKLASIRVNYNIAEVPLTLGLIVRLGR